MQGLQLAGGHVCFQPTALLCTMPATGTPLRHVTRRPYGAHTGPGLVLLWRWLGCMTDLGVWLPNSDGIATMY